MQTQRLKSEDERLDTLQKIYAAVAKERKKEKLPPPGDVPIVDEPADHDYDEENETFPDADDSGLMTL